MHLTRFSPLLSILLLATPAISNADEILVGPTNKAGFQAAVDAANPGDEISCLGGVYDFSDLGAVLITKGLEIEAADSDNPPIFVGLVDSLSGDYVRIPGPGITNISGNTAFAVPPGAVVEGLEMEGLHFQGFERAIFTAVGWDFNSMGCWSTTEGSIKELGLSGNTISNCYYGIQLLGGPIEDFEIKDNLIDCSTGFIALSMQADYIPCGPVFVNTARLTNGEVKDNTLFGGPATPTSGAFPAMNVAGVEGVEVKSNTVFAQPGTIGILVRDDKAFTFGPFGPSSPAFGDDGPIETGEIKGNTVHNASFGIVCQGSTTLQDVEIKGNTMVNSMLFDIFLADSNAPPGFSGANGFIVKENTFSGTALVAPVFLGGATVNNVILVTAGTFVLDTSPLGNNVILFD